MTQKERIIELVKQNVISMDEALQLLEAASKQENNSSVDPNEFVKEYQEAQASIENELNQKSDKNINKIDEEKKVLEEKAIQEKAINLNEELNKKQEALTIAKQRLRELEIFAELDELTEEMINQKAALSTKIESLESEIEELSVELDVSRQEQRQNTQAQFKKIVEDTTDQVTKVARNFSEEAKKEGKNLQKNMMTYLKELASSFDMKEFNVTVPWVKSNKFKHEFEYEVTDLTALTFKLLNGSLSLQLYDGDKVKVDVDATLYGKEEGNLVEVFEALTKIDVTAENMLFDLMNARIAADLVVRLPKKSLSKLTIDAFNGDVTVDGLDVKEFELKSKNGDISISNTNSELLIFDGYNGDLIVTNSMIKDIDYHVLNGDLRITDNVGNITAETINGDIFLTKTNEAAAIINAKTLSGDIKVSVPKEMNLEIKAESTYGQVQHRLSNVDQLGERYDRQLDSDKETVKLELMTTSGSIYLKD